MTQKSVQITADERLIDAFGIAAAERGMTKSTLGAYALEYVLERLVPAQDVVLVAEPPHVVEAVEVSDFAGRTATLASFAVEADEVGE